MYELDELEKNLVYYDDIKYVYHGTCYPIFEYGDGLLKNWSFYSVIESKVFAKRCFSKQLLANRYKSEQNKNKFLPIIIKYEVIRPFENILLFAIYIENLK